MLYSPPTSPSSTITILMHSLHGMVTLMVHNTLTLLVHSPSWCIHPQWHLRWLTLLVCAVRRGCLWKTSSHAAQKTCPEQLWQRTTACAAPHTSQCFPSPRPSDMASETWRKPRLLPPLGHLPQYTETKRKLGLSLPLCHLSQNTKTNRKLEL